MRSALRAAPSQRPLRRMLASSTSAAIHPASTAAAAAPQKREGDISDAFASLAGSGPTPLPARYAAIKASLIRGHEAAVRDSWVRLLRALRDEVPRVAALGPAIVPEVTFADVASGRVPEDFMKRYRETGVAVVRGVVPEEEVLAWKEDLREYIRANPQTKAFPASNPQVYELYWSRAQLLARAHPSLATTHRFLMSPWHSTSVAAPLSTRHPIAYADRLRMRLPGDTAFALGPHVDGGSVERWDPAGYGGAGGVYAAVWRGEWERHDPWEASARLGATSDLHAGVGACSAFRMAQGWLAMSRVAPGEGTLLVNPMLRLATAYFLLRPFFAPLRPLATGASTTAAAAITNAATEAAEAAFLHEDNWAPADPSDTTLHGAAEGRGQELHPSQHPHLALPSTMVHVPRVSPGDYVAWHCDAAHAVDGVHRGAADSSVLYIPACPLTEGNAVFLRRQRRAFAAGGPGVDFGGGVGEAGHVGRVGVEGLEGAGVRLEGRRAMGLEEWDAEEEGLVAGEREACLRANKILGFYG